MSLLNYFQKLPPDTPNVASASSGLTSRETEEVSKELKKMQDKGEKKEKFCVWTPQQRLEILIKKTIDTISALRLRGAPVTSSVINAVAKGSGHLPLSNDWARKVLTLGRKMTRRIATTAKIPVAPAL